jgi:hypothetical protein
VWERVDRQTKLPTKKLLMAKPNYSGEKRRKDLAKKAKKEEKRLRKLHAKENPSSDDAEPTEPPEAGEATGSEG